MKEKRKRKERKKKERKKKSSKERNQEHDLESEKDSGKVKKIVGKK